INLRVKGKINGWTPHSFYLNFPREVTYKLNTGVTSMVKIKFTLLIFFSSFQVFPQSDSVKLFTLSEVVVSATKTENLLYHLASSVTVIDSAEIERKKSTNVLDLLKSEYGISIVQQGSFGTLANVFTRGGNSGHTLVLIDGVEVNMPND